MAEEVKTPVYFGVSREMFRKLTEKAEQMHTSRSGVAGEAVRAYLASPFPVRGYRLDRGEQFRRIATFLTAQEHARLRALAREFGTDEAPVSLSTVIREAVIRFLGSGPNSASAQEAPPSGIIPTVPLEDAKRPPGSAGEKTEDEALSGTSRRPGRAARRRRREAHKDGRAGRRRRTRPEGRA